MFFYNIILHWKKQTFLSHDSVIRRSFCKTLCRPREEYIETIHKLPLFVRSNVLFSEWLIWNQTDVFPIFFCAPFFFTSGYSVDSLALALCHCSAGVVILAAQQAQSNFKTELTIKCIDEIIFVAFTMTSITSFLLYPNRRKLTLSIILTMT